MKCPSCGFEESKVLDTRSANDDTAIRRRRECLKCGCRFTTYETIEVFQLTVCKRDNSREPFDRQKIMNGLLKACRKRPVTERQMEDLIDSIELDIRSDSNGEVSTAYIGEQIATGLKALDDVAYVRFVSVYRQFKDIDTFIDEINFIKKEKDSGTK